MHKEENMPTPTTNLGLLVYSANEYQTLFRDFWRTINFIGAGSPQDPYSAFQIIDSKVGELLTRINTLETTVENTFADTMEDILEDTY